MSDFINDIVLFAFFIGCCCGAVVATIGWIVWAFRAMAHHE